jgi:hypothetical protein
MYKKRMLFRSDFKPMSTRYVVILPLRGARVFYTGDSGEESFYFG